MRLTLRQLQIFAAIARNGSTAAAGDEVGLSQSASSAALNELERLLSRPLFDRTGKRLVINENGRLLLPKALALLDAAADIEREADCLENSPPPLRIGASTTIGNHVLPQVLQQYLARWTTHSSTTDWHTRIMIGNTAEVCRMVCAFELDIGLIEGPSHEPDLQTRPWVNDELVLVAAPAMAAKMQANNASGVVSLRRLQAQVWLLREQGSGTRMAMDAALLPSLHTYRKSIELGSSEAIKYAAAQGLGIACVSQWVVSEMVQSGKLVRLQTSLPRLIRPFYIVMHRDKAPTHALHNLLTQLSTVNLT
ncbi:LysR family transcriptional regulator [Lampropedia aestuarii]|uniref:LysR family transcriptional regulator n=1 Tax=Lampropedia aestuarii TaxID=2562762 RepID=UPI0024694370|nr:LysR family transcriptional regulator [Lampropedia aestuarii]MDH5856897.1 LysR family transcriptional regulator [Lampropedia aestuarii]